MFENAEACLRSILEEQACEHHQKILLEERRRALSRMERGMGVSKLLPWSHDFFFRELGHEVRIFDSYIYGYHEIIMLFKKIVD